jgi:hypothetical protein
MFFIDDAHVNVWLQSRPLPARGRATTASLFQLCVTKQFLYRFSWSRVIGTKTFKSSQVNTLPNAKSQAKDKRAKDRQKYAALRCKVLNPH